MNTIVINNYIITNQCNGLCTPERRTTPVEPNAPGRQRRPVSETPVPVFAFPEEEEFTINSNLQYDEDSESESEIDAPYVTMTRGNYNREDDSDMEIDDEEETVIDDEETVIDQYEPMDIDDDDDDNTVRL